MSVAVKQRRRLGVTVMRVVMMGMAMIVVMAVLVFVLHRPQFAPKPGANRERA
jgi:hypothetical protein